MYNRPLFENLDETPSGIRVIIHCTLYSSHLYRKSVNNVYQGPKLVQEKKKKVSRFNYKRRTEKESFTEETNSRKILNGKNSQEQEFNIFK